MAEIITNFIAPVFYKLVFMSITGVFAGLAALLVRRFADTRISPYWKCAIWLVMLVALIVPFRPQSPLSLVSGVQQIQNISFAGSLAQSASNESDIDTETNWASPEQPKPVETSTQRFGENFLEIIFDMLFPSIWLTGFIGFFLCTLISRIRLEIGIKRSSIKYDVNLFNKLLTKCKDRLALTKNPEIIVQGYIDTPALMGIMRPKIILPSYIVESPEDEIEYILIHELAHIKRLDMFVNYLLIGLNGVYWFNPLVWLMFRLIRQDLELASDFLVINAIGQNSQKAYSRSLISVLERSSHNKTPIAPRLCMVDGKNGMKRRINMIKQIEAFKQRRIIIAISSILVIITTGLLFLTGSAQTAETKQLLMTPDAKTTTTPTTLSDLSDFKGLELYVWKNKEITGNDNIYFTLLSGTNRIKVPFEIFNLAIAVSDVVEVNKMLEPFSQGLYLFIMHGPDITEDELTTITQSLVLPENTSISAGLSEIFLTEENPRPKADIPAKTEESLTEKIERNLDILSEPSGISFIYSHIALNQSAFDEIVALDYDALVYMFTKFEKGGQTDFRAMIMACACETILGEQGIMFGIGQEWYDKYKKGLVGDIDPRDIKDDIILKKKGYQAIIYAIETLETTPVPNFSYTGDDPVLALVYQSLIEKGMDRYARPPASFIVVAPHVFASYQEQDRLKVFTTAQTSFFQLKSDIAELRSDGITSFAITYKKDQDGKYHLESLEPSMDGGMFAESIRNFCTMPVSGEQIPGLADKIINHYKDYADLKPLLKENLANHLKGLGYQSVKLRQFGWPDEPLS